MDKGFNLPLTHNVPVEVANEFNEEIERDKTYISIKQIKIGKTYNNLKKVTTLRKVGDYLLTQVIQEKEISIGEIAKTLNISKNTVKIHIATLNSWNNYPLTMIPVPKKKEYIQSVLKNNVDYENWDLKKERTIATMEQVRSKAKTLTRAKAKSKKEITEKEKEIEVQVKES